MTNITVTSNSTADRAASCPPWCDGPSNHEPITYTDERGTHTRTHNHRAGAWLLASYDSIDLQGQHVAGGCRVEWEPSGELGSAQVERDHLATLLELSPGAVSSTFREMEASAEALGLKLSEWAATLDGVMFDHPQHVRSANCPSWCAQRGRLHTVSRDSVDVGQAPTVRHEWHQDINGRAWVSLTRFDWPDEAPTTEVVVEDGGDGFSVDMARRVAFAVLDACALADGGELVPDDALVLRIAATKEWDDVSVTRSGGLSSSEAIDYAASALDNARKALDGSDQA